MVNLWTDTPTLFSQLLVLFLLLYKPTCSKNFQAASLLDIFLHIVSTVLMKLRQEKLPQIRYNVAESYRIGFTKFKV